MTERTDKTAGAAADVIGQALDEVKVKKGTLASFVEAQAPEIAKALPGGLVDAESHWAVRRSTYSSASPRRFESGASRTKCR